MYLIIIKDVTVKLFISGCQYNVNFAKIPSSKINCLGVAKCLK